MSVDGPVYQRFRQFVVLGLAIFALGVLALPLFRPRENAVPVGRREVAFWHFWGGADRDVVEDVVRRFNASQSKYWVRAIAVPGNNFDAKLFLSIAGGAPPDLVNQDDPVIADWYGRGAVQAIEDMLSPQELAALRAFLLPAAKRLAEVDGRLIGVPNGLDLRMLYFNQSELERRGLTVPRTLGQFDAVVDAITPPGTDLQTVSTVAFLPDARRLWTWGYVFGGSFYDQATGRVTLETPPIVAALTWMIDRCRGFGPDGLAAFRRGDQSLPGKTFPLLPTDDAATVGRYVFMLDGQWRVRDIEAFQRDRRVRGISPVEFGVCPLPYPESGVGRARSGWVNGNFFLVPRGARNPAGAWAFMQYWIGLQDAGQAAETCQRGGWIPVSRAVIETPTFQAYLAAHPLMARFVELADSEQLFPYPQVPGAMYFLREVQAAAESALARPASSLTAILHQAESRIQSHLDAQRRQTMSQGANQ